MKLSPIRLILQSAFALVLLCLAPAAVFSDGLEREPDSRPHQQGDNPLVFHDQGSVVSAPRSEKGLFKSTEDLKAYLLKNPKLTKLTVMSCPGLTSLPELPRLSSLPFDSAPSRGKSLQHCWRRVCAQSSVAFQMPGRWRWFGGTRGVIKIETHFKFIIQDESGVVCASA